MTALPKHRSSPRLQLFVHDLTATGVVRNAIAIANRAAADGYAVRLLTAQARGALRGNVAPGVEVVELLGDAQEQSRRSQMRRILLAYRRMTQEWRPDLLLSAGTHGHLLSSLAWQGLAGTKILRISNDLGARTGRGGLKTWQRRLKIRALTAAADRVVLVSREQQRDPLFGRLLSNGKGVLIPNGVDVPRVREAAGHPCPHPWMSADVPVVLGVGRAVAVKNYPTLIRAVALARRDRPLRLIILGEADPAAESDLRALAQGEGIGDAFDRVPATDNPFTYMEAASVVALPSLWEGSSNVILEALACGTPVIASRTAGDAWHVLDQGRFGLLVDPLDVNQLADAILRQTGSSRVLPGERADGFSAERALDGYMQLFGQALAAKGST